ncbi:serine hydrolase [bacterium]|nr:serine hydrolase [bacterium]
MSQSWLSGSKAMAVAAAAALAACTTPPTGGVVRPPPTVTTLEIERPGVAGWDEAALRALADYAREQKSTALVIVADGQTILNRTWPPEDPTGRFANNLYKGESASGEPLEDVASQQKSFIAVIAGIAIDRGFLDPAKLVSDYLGPGWSKAGAGQEGEITVENLLRMSSGLDEQLAYEAPAGTQFFYNTPAYARLKPVLEKATGMTLDALTEDWLARPLGLADTRWAVRPAALAGADNPTGLVTSPRDLVRFGEMILAGGVGPDGRRLLSEAEFKAMLSPAATNPAYGRLWWLNDGAYALQPGRRRIEGRAVPEAPADMVAANGAFNRHLFVVPSARLIVVRMGDQPETGFPRELWKRIMAAAPAGGTE